MSEHILDNTLARIKELLARAPSEPWTFLDFDNADLIVELRNNAEALISRLEAAEASLATYINDTVASENRIIDAEFAATEAEARAAAAEAACVDARRALGLALLADGLCDEIKVRLKIAWLKVGGSNARAALTANPKDTGGEIK